MPLSSTTHEALADLEDICLTMMDGESSVRVEVQRKLLAALGNLGQNSPTQQLAILEKHRGQVERVASAKYEEGDYCSYANGCVVRITPADWERYN